MCSTTAPEELEATPWSGNVGSTESAAVHNNIARSLCSFRLRLMKASPRSPGLKVPRSPDVGRLRFPEPTFAFPRRYFANEPFADFHRVEGVRGVYIATLINGSFNEENMRSVITFDKGGTWEPLQPPAQTRYGEQIDCQVARGGKGQGGDRGRSPPRKRLGGQSRRKRVPPRLSKRRGPD